MCGICGHVRHGHRPDPEGLNPILSRLAHRGPDGHGTWGGDGCALGHARLAILDLTDHASQPMLDPATGNVMVFNGEIYNFQELRDELEAKGHTFTSTGDTEVALRLYSVMGRDFVHRLRGMFALAVWDAGRQELFLARDRLGKKPLFYAETPKGFFFASEISALAAHPDIPLEADPQALDLFLSVECIPAPWSAYTSIRKLPPASHGVLDKSGLNIRPYWELDYREKLDVSEAEALRLIEEELTEAVRLRLISDVPLGGLLSGGVDSSLVTAIMADLSPGRVKTFTIGFGEEKYNELPHAQEAARILGVENHFQIMPAQSLELLPDAAARYGEPFADDSSLASMFLTRMAREHITVALGGDGGDELACGYPSYGHLRPAMALDAVFAPGPLPRSTVRSLLHSNSPMAKLARKALIKLRPEYKLVFRAERKALDFKRRLYTEDMVRQCEDAALTNALHWIERSLDRSDNPVERTLWLDTRTSLPDILLVKMDIASMTNSLEVRSPLLDQKLMELFARLPWQLKIKNNTPKYLLKKLAEKYFPAEFLSRRKQGFSMPVADWLRGGSSGFMREVFAQARPALSGRFRVDQLDALVEEHIAGRKNHKHVLWRMLNLALWELSRHA